MKDKIIIGIAGAEYGVRGFRMLTTRKPANAPGVSGLCRDPTNLATRLGRVTVGSTEVLPLG